MDNIFYETVLMRGSYIQHYKRKIHDKNSGLADVYKYYVEYARSNGEMHTVMTSQDIYYRWVKGQKTYVKTFTLGNEISIKLETMEENQDEVQNAERIRYGTLESKRTRL